MKVVVIGDVSWKGQYHLGDEAMTEAAVSQLQRRGAEVTLVAGTPEVSQGIYGVPCVPIFNFAAEKTRGRRERRISELLEAVRGQQELRSEDQQTVDAVLGADAVVIGGGGNLNSSGAHHVYERLALKRLAEHAGIPLFVSSQTVGPHLLPFDLNLVKEIANYAQVFGARERGTAHMMREVCGSEANIVATFDDALLLEPADRYDDLATRLSLPDKFVVGSFTYHPGNTGLSSEAYYREVAGMLDKVVAISEVEVVLLPHMGVLGATEQDGEANDVFGHNRITHYAESGQIRSLQMISARDLLAVTRRAEFTLSTRYHPLVFGGAVGVPAVGIVTSYYSAQRMRGALRGIGAESFALPFESWPNPFGPKVLAALRDKRDQIAQVFVAGGALQREYQEKWWDQIVHSVETKERPDIADAEYPNQFGWETSEEGDLLAVARASQEQFNKYRMNNHTTIQAYAVRLTRLETEQAHLKALLSRKDEELLRLKEGKRPRLSDFPGIMRRWLRR